MKIVVNTYAEGPFVLLVQPRVGVVNKEDADDAFIVGLEREGHSSTIDCFLSKEGALKIAEQYKDDAEYPGVITVMSIRDAGFLKRFMSM